MASANKQQKRATRAKAKAKQNRTQRAAAPVELDPNDDRIDFDSVDLTELFKEMLDAQKSASKRCARPSSNTRCSHWCWNRKARRSPLTSSSAR